MPRQLKPDAWLLGAVLFLLLAGVVNVASSAGVIAQDSRVGFIERQIVLALVCLVLLLTALHVDVRPWLEGPFLTWAYWGSVVALGFLFLLPAYHNVHRFYRIGGFLLQASEFAKIAVVLVIARLLAERELRASLLPAAARAGAPMFLILLEPDLGISFLIGITVFSMLILKGLPWKPILIALGAGLLLGILAVATVGYRMQRIEKFVSGTEDQAVYAKIALGSGGLLGKGLGAGHQKFHYLSKPHTDFAYAILGEEFGFVGTVLVLAAYGLLFARGMQMAARLETLSERYTAFGLTLMVTVQAMIHISVNTNLMPPKGITLPLVSYGGSSLLSTTLLLAVLLSFSMRKT